MGCRRTECLFDRLVTESSAVPLFRTHKIIRPNEANSALRARQAEGWNMHVALSAKDTQMPNLTWFVAAVTLHMLVGMADQARLFVRYWRCLQMNFLGIYGDDFMKL
jgi:hypothetical protein